MTVDTGLLARAIAARSSFVDAEHRTAFRVFNGHLEGDSRYVVDIYGRSAVVFHHGTPGEDGDVRAVVGTVRLSLPWVEAVVLKEREGDDAARRGTVVHPEELDDGDGSVGERDIRVSVDTSVLEHGVTYAIDLFLNQDAGFYLDTRGLRRWLIDTSEGKSVLNTFAYTGSLGVAAVAGGATRVLHTDLNERSLQVARASYARNGFPVSAGDFQVRDFWSFVRGMKLQKQSFDTVILDPPFFSTTAGGTVDLSRNTTQLINKVRPLVRSGGKLVVVNNSLFVSGEAFMRELEALCVGGWLTVERTIAVGDDVRGFPETRRGEPVSDPAPFGHSTKIVVLGVRHR